MGVLRDCKFFWGAYDLTGDTNKIDLVADAAMKEDTVYGDSALSRAKGLEDIKLAASGFLNLGAGQLEEALMGALMATFALEDIPVTIGLLTGAEGEAAHFFLGSHSNYKTGGPVGDMLPYSVDVIGRGTKLCRGNILQNGIELVTGTSTPFNLGLVASGKKLYGVLHVVAASGTLPTLDVIVQSDALETFLSPTTRITFSQKTAIGYQWATPIAGPISDDIWFRCQFTIGGTTPSFTLIVAVAIL